MPEPLDITPEARRWFAAAGLSIKASYRIDEVAVLLDCKHRVIFKMLARGDLDRLKLHGDGKRMSPTRIPISSLLSLLD